MAHIFPFFGQFLLMMYFTESSYVCWTCCHLGGKKRMILLSLYAGTHGSWPIVNLMGKNYFYNVAQPGRNGRMNESKMEQLERGNAGRQEDSMQGRKEGRKEFCLYFSYISRILMKYISKKILYTSLEMMILMPFAWKRNCRKIISL